MRFPSSFQTDDQFEEWLREWISNEFAAGRLSFRAAQILYSFL